MSVSKHPVALQLERRVGGATRLLATVMALPLIDGIFPALVIAGALNDPTGILEAGLLIFGGSATVAVILAEMEGSPREQAGSILLLGAVLLPLAAVEAALAETLASVLRIDLFSRFAGLVILTIAAKTASSKVGEYLPSPGVIVALGLVASFQPANAELALTLDPTRIVHGTAAAATGIGFALAVALLGPRLRGTVDIDLFRFGSSVALGMLALSVLGLMPTEQPVALGVLAVTALFAYDPDGVSAPDLERSDSAASAPADAVPDGGDGYGDGPEDSTVGDAPDPERPDAAAFDADDGDGRSEYGYPEEGETRAPWL